MSKVFICVPVSELPEKDGWYDLIDPTGDYNAETRYFKKDYWFESEKHAENGTIDEDDSVEHLFWLRPLISLPIDRETARKIASEAWEAALDEGDAANPTKDEYLKQFE